MKSLRFFCFIVLYAWGIAHLRAQINSYPKAFLDEWHELHSHALDSVIIEKYYVSDANDAADETGGNLPVGAKTYRVFADLKPDYSLLSIMAYDAVPFTKIRIKSNGLVFNNMDRGVSNASILKARFLPDNTVMLDSWFTLGAVSEKYIGVLKEDDTDGSIIDGSALLANDDEWAGTPLTESDGLMEGVINGSPSTPEDKFESLLGFENVENMDVELTNYIFYVPENVKGHDEKNRILIAQFTTAGDSLMFDFNLQLSYKNDSIKKAMCEKHGVGNSMCKEAIVYLINAYESEDPVLYDDVVGSLQYYIVHDEMSQHLVYKNKTDHINGHTLKTIDIYPNPVRNQLVMTIPENVMHKDASVQIRTMDGRVVLSHGMHAVNRAELMDVSSLSPGIYFIQVNFGSEVYVNRFVKQ